MWWIALYPTFVQPNNIQHTPDDSSRILRVLLWLPKIHTQHPRKYEAREILGFGFFVRQY